MFGYNQKGVYGRPSWKGNYMLYYCYITKSRLNVQFVKKIPLEMVIGQQTKEEGYDQNKQWLLH